MTRAVGDIKAENVMQRIVPEPEKATLQSLEIIRWLNPQALIRLVRDEHPQAIALLLVQLDPEVAAQVLHGLPEAVQPEVVHRIATLGPIAPEALAMLEELVTRKLRQTDAGEALNLGGPQDAANIVNSAGKAMEKRVMPEIQKRDRALARSIEEEMFKFEHLFALDPQGMGALLREVESDILIDALKGIAADQREVFFRAMSSRAADGLRDEIEERGRLKLADVIAAQKRVVAIAKRLAAEGILSFGSEEDDYV
jgi:flagellar motor switch protein FliG